MDEDETDTKASFTPRSYQVQMMDIAMKQNTIIYLPTGSGKTFIAILVLKQLSEDLARPYGEGGKISLILVNSVALVDQHVKYVQDHTCFRVAGYTGEMNVDYWSKELWQAQYNKYQVLVMTTQILVNTINTKFIDLSKVSLIIFDECHRGVDDQPMRQVMKNFQYLSEMPRILGLTATLLNGNCKLGKVMEKVHALETTYLSKVATVDGLEDVVGYSTNPQEQFTVYHDESNSEIIQLMVAVLDKTAEQLKYINFSDDHNEKPIPQGLVPYDRVDILKQLRNFIIDLKIHIEMLGVFGGWKACLAQIIQIERVKVHCDDARLAMVLGYVQTTIDLMKTRFEKTMVNKNPRDKIHFYASEKLRKLFGIFKDFSKASKEELCCLVFVQRRVTAKVLNLILSDLSKVDPDFYHLKTNFIVGNKNNPYNMANRENQFISKKNREVLQSFVNKEYNILCASNVLEEGVDIPKCTLVIKFDKAEDYRAYIQSKGRARHKSSIFYTMVESRSAQKYLNKYNEFQAIEKCLNDFLVGKNEERDDPSLLNISSMFNEAQLEPYFVNGKDSAKVDMISAVSLLCQYCSSLSSDIYTVCAPEWYLKRDKGKQCVIYLPLSSGITDPVEGRSMSDKKNAKRAAALEACKLLHKCGQLDDNLLPLKKTIPEENVSHLFQHIPTEKDDRAGLKKKKRLHSKHTANCLLGDLTKMQYLHVIKLRPSYERIQEFQNSAVYDMYTTALCFGFLTPHPLRSICTFPVYDSNGEIVVELIVNVAVLNLTENELYQLREFHFTVFNDVLEILKPFLIFDNTGYGTDILLLVPVQNGNSAHIDFDILKECKFVKPKQREPTSTEKLQLQITEETYLNKIVIPWYRPQATMYLVTMVCMDKTPSSNFPNTDYPSFKAYFEEKHHLRTLNSSQPLVLVKGLSKRLNTYKPRSIERKKTRAKRYEELEEYLIPEFVIKQDFPACLWIQARFLPTILSRIVYLFKLQQLQYEIARDIGATLKKSSLQPLQLDYYLLNYEPLEMRFLKPTEVSVSNVFNDFLALESPPLVTQQFNKDFLTKKLESEYSWKNIEEPKDIERNVDVTAAEIEYYEKFINKTVDLSERLFKNESPTKNNIYPAITFDLDYRHNDIKILEIQYNNQVPNLCDFYRALTAAEANDIMNLERLETLGDSFLKFAASLYVILKFPNYNEGRSTTLRSRLISNKNLYYAGVAKNLGGILRNSDLSPNEEWSPPYFCVPSTINNGIVNKDFSVTTLFNCNLTRSEQISGILDRDLKEITYEECLDDEENTYTTMCHFLQKQYVGDKTVADCVEALLGAFFQNGGVDGALKFIEWIGIIPKSENIKYIIENVSINPVVNPRAKIQDINRHLPQCEELEKRLGYRFRNRAFLLQALSHISFTPNRITLSYEKLEFIGDAILDFLLTCYIFENCGNLDPGEVTDLRSALVNNNTFASLAVRNGFHKFMLLISSLLQKQIDQFASYLQSKNYVIDDEVLILLEEEDLNMADYLDVPKVLGDLFEALAGAVFLDSGKDLKTVWKVFYKIMWKEIDLFSKNVPKNVLRRLYECHTAYPSFNEPTDAPNNRTMLALDFICEGRRKRVYGFGSNKNQAKKAAAKIALRALKL